MTRLDLRAEGEAELERKILEDGPTRRTVEELGQRSDLGARRHLLATSVRVTRAMSPRLDDLLASCRQTLGVDHRGREAARRLVRDAPLQPAAPARCAVLRELEGVLSQRFAGAA